jgi:hypothetical protein
MDPATIAKTHPLRLLDRLVVRPPFYWEQGQDESWYVVCPYCEALAVLPEDLFTPAAHADGCPWAEAKQYIVHLHVLNNQRRH